MLSLYWPQQSWLHRLKAGHKLLLLAAISLIVLPVDDWWVMLLILIASASIYFTLSPSGWRQLAVVKPVLWFVALIMLVHILTGTFVEGILASARLLALFLLASLLTLTTRLHDIMHAIEPALRPFSLIGLPPRKIAVAVAIMIRFIPQISHSADELRAAWVARGGRAQGRWQLLTPLFISVLRSADSVGDALLARGGAEIKANNR